MSIFEGILLGLTQGLTEFLPVSSTGHLIIVRQLLGLHDPSGIFFDAVLHLATLLAVALYFRRDIGALVMTAWKYIRRKPLDENEKNFFLAIVLGTIPAIILGLIFEDAIGTSARSTMVVAWGLVIGSIVMFAAERHVRTDAQVQVTPRLGWRLGLFQAFALFPGISRSGSTISGGLFSGMTRSDATRFAFVLSFPILLGAGSVSALELFKAPLLHVSASLVAAFITALVSAFIAIHFLLKFVRTRTLHPFIWYRLILAALLFFFPF